MKSKFFNIVFSIWLLFLQIGFSTNIHFCQGEASTIAIQLIVAENNTCESSCCHDKGEKYSCCENNVVDLQIESSIHTSNQLDLDNLLFDFLVVDDYFHFNFELILVQKSNPQYSYERIVGIPFYSLYSQRIFYS